MHCRESNPVPIDFKMRMVHNIRGTRFFQIKWETLTLDLQLVSNHFLLKPFYDLKLEFCPVEESNPVPLDFKMRTVHNIRGQIKLETLSSDAQ